VAQGGSPHQPTIARSPALFTCPGYLSGGVRRMRFAKTAAAACTVATALVITAATAHAEPAAPPDTVAATVSGVDHGIGYQITVSPVDEAVIATVGTGRFGFGPGGAVLLQTDGGTALAEVPLSYAAEGRTIALTPHIDAAGHTLT